MADDVTIEPKMEVGLTNPKNGHIAATFLLEENEKKRLLACLNDIEKNDPLRTRRLSLQQESDSPRLISKEYIKDLAQLQNILEEPTFVSHRKYLGPIIIIYKKSMFRFFRKWLGVSLNKQFELNQRLLNLALVVHTLENRINNLEKSIQGRQ